MIQHLSTSCHERPGQEQAKPEETVLCPSHPQQPPAQEQEPTEGSSHLGELQHSVLQPADPAPSQQPHIEAHSCMPCQRTTSSTSQALCHIQNSEAA